MDVGLFLAGSLFAYGLAYLTRLRSSERSRQADFLADLTVARRFDEATRRIGALAAENHALHELHRDLRGRLDALEKRLKA